MWERYEGKYFEGRDFYDWGVDFDLPNIVDNFKKSLDTLNYYSKIVINTEQVSGIDTRDLTKKEKSFLKILLEEFSSLDINNMNNLIGYNELIKSYPRLEEICKELKLNKVDLYLPIIVANMKFDFNTVHYKMIITQLYTILDECLSQFIKAISMYYNTILEDVNIKANIEDIEKIENHTDLSEFFIDNALRYENRFSGIIEKIKILIKKCCENKVYNYSDIIQLKQERDCIVHRNSKYDKKAVQVLGNKFKENEQIVLDNTKVQNYFDKSMELVSYLLKEIVAYYTPNFGHY